MPLSSSDRSFGVIALQRKYVSRDALVAAEKELELRRTHGVTEALGDFLVQKALVSERQKAKVEKVRAPHGRHCHACARVTFLLPGESDATKACEHCGGRLRQRAPDHVLAQAGEDTPTATGKIVAIVGGKDPKRETERARRMQDSASNLRAMDDADSTAPVPGVRSTRRFSPTGPAAPGGTSGASAASSSSATTSPVDGSDRFAPPPEPGEPPTKRFAIAGLTTPGPADGSLAPVEVKVLAPEPGFVGEVMGVFGYPFAGLGVVIITVPAAIRALLWDTTSVVPLGLAFATLVYHAQATRQVVAGDRHPPPRPGLVELFQLAHVPLATIVACFAPFLLLFSFEVKAFFSAPDMTVDSLVTVGNTAHLRASKIAKSSGVNVSEVVVHDLAGRPWKVGDRRGRWLVFGLLSCRDESSGEADLAIKEIEDLARLAEAAQDVDVAAVYIDPEDKIAKNIHPATHTTALKILRTRDAALPPPLEDARPNIPTIFIVSPKGEVRRELDHGASDEALFGALLVLQRGGTTLGEIRPVALYKQQRAFGAGGVSPLAAGLLFLGVVYWPMALLMTLFGDPVRAFRYHEGIRAILSTAGEYALALAMGGSFVVVVLIGRSLTHNLLGEPRVTAFVTWWLGAAAALAFSAAVGRYFAHHSNEFSWAKSRTPGKQAPRPDPAAASAPGGSSA